MVQADRIARCWLVILSWALFGLGLAVQLAAPRPAIEHGAFVITDSMTRHGKISPMAIVARERWMQAASALLTVGGALGLAFCYRRSLPIRHSH